MGSSANHVPIVHSTFLCLFIHLMHTCHMSPPLAFPPSLSLSTLAAFVAASSPQPFSKRSTEEQTCRLRKAESHATALPTAPTLSGLSQPSRAPTSCLCGGSSLSFRRRW